jgi:hypothetical protein
VPLRDLGLHVLALLVYPGALATLAFGVAAEAAVALALGRTGPRESLVATVARLRGAVSGTPRLAVPLLAMLAATQLAAPFNPVSPLERSLVVAAIALAAVAWLGWARGWSTAGVRLTLLVQGCFLVALLAPALVSESLRPQVLGAVVVPAALPVKIAAGLLAVLCVPALLPLPPAPAPGGAAEEEAALTRLLLWLPLCGLLVSLLVPPGGDDAGRLLRFLGGTVVVAAAAIGLAALAGRARVGGLYPRVLVPVAAGVLVLAAVTSALT